MRRELLACGLSAEGQLGIRSSNDFVRLPEHVVGGSSDTDGTTIVSVACGEKHALFLDNEGKVYSVGSNDHGQLGRGQNHSGSFTICPVNFKPGITISQVCAGRSHSIAVTDDGRVLSFGSNSRGQLALDHKIKSADLPTRIPITEVIQASSGPDHVIALMDSGRVFVWGEQWDGACLHEPTEVTALFGIPIIRVVAGGRHCMALSRRGSVYMWGQNEHGQLGVGDTMPKEKPVCLESLQSMRVIEISAGYSHSVFLTFDGRLFSCGSDQFGQAGLGKRPDDTKQTIPVAVPDLMGTIVTRAACGHCHTVVVVGGRLLTFGLNKYGQLGNGREGNQISPRSVEELDRVTAVFAGWHQTFLIRSGGVQEIVVGYNGPMALPRILTKSGVIELIHDEERGRMRMIELLESTLSTVAGINGSFLFPGEQRFNSGDLKCHGVDLDAVMDSFAAVNDMLQDDFKSITTTALPLSVFNGEYNPRNFMSPECLRYILILPWIDAFLNNMDFATAELLHLQLAINIAQLKPSHRKLLECWWAFLPLRHFNRVVQCFKAALVAFVQKKKGPSYCLPVLQVLESLHTISSATKKLPLESFYVSQLNDFVDLKHDYLMMRSLGDTQHWACYPFLMNGVAKADIMLVESVIRQQVALNENIIRVLGMTFFRELPNFNIRVRRNHLVQDTINVVLNAHEKDLVKPVKVEFVGEEAEDAGGVRKEFFMLLFQKILASEYGMFLENPESHLVWFSGFVSSDGMEDAELTDNYRLLGILCGLATYNSILVDYPFPLAIYKLILDQHPTLEDLTELSPTEGKGLQSLLDYEEDDFTDVFCLNFTISFNQYGSPVTVDLKDNGSNIDVTQKNKQEYVNLYVKHRMEIGFQEGMSRHIEMFRRGFKDVLPSKVLMLFQPRELQEMVAGNENYNWDDLKKVVKYKGDYNADHITIKTFWAAFNILTNDEKRNFMKFLMGSPRLPVKGISDVDITIQPCAAHLLPAAHTCANLLDLPEITDITEMLRRLRIAIEHHEGFSLV